MYSEATQVKEIIDKAHKIVVVQADNPDADSLGSALAVESILGDLGKEVSLYCAVDMPGYLRYLVGWDRVQRDLPREFDASIIVDASTMTLLDKLSQSGQKGWLATKPCIVIDHHETVDNTVPFAEVMINDGSRAATGELIYLLAKQLEWSLPLAAQEFIMTAILGDTQGLTNQLASAETYRVMAQIVDAGVDRPALEELRRSFSKMPVEIYKYKAALIAHTNFSEDHRIASVVVPQVEINQYSPLYNPAPLIQNDMLQTTDVAIAIVFKDYDDGHMTAAIRCNPGAGVGAKLAKHFGGGGHAYASGFKVVSSRPFNEIKSECLEYAAQLLAKLDEDTPDETIQYAYQTD
jgi:phosphoesterase RecJ-like protein